VVGSLLRHNIEKKVKDREKGGKWDQNAGIIANWLLVKVINQLIIDDHRRLAQESCWS
jgi:hypothetical protein